MSNSPMHMDDIDDESVGVRVTSPKCKKKRKSTSKVWRHYTRLGKDGNRDVAKCKYCEIELKGGGIGGTSRLWRHFKENCTTYEKEKDGGNITPRLENFKFSQERSRKDLTEAIIIHEYPFSIVEHVAFRKFLRNLQPQFIVVSRHSIRNDCLEIYETLKERLVDELRSLECRTSVTADFWLSNQNISYLCITCHFIDNDWKLQKRIINFSKVDSKQTGDLIAKMIYGKLCGWNIDRKLFCCVLDNCSANDVAVRELKKMILSNKHLPCLGHYFHVWCWAHILNIMVQDGLLCVQDVVYKVLESVKYVKASAVRETNFKMCADQLDGPKVSLVQDVSTRWNSTYVMIDVALKFEDVFSRFASLDENYKHLPSDEEWENLKIVNDGLKIFYDLTKLFSGTKYTTSNVSFSMICELKLKLNSWHRNINPFVSAMGVRMLKKCDKYWKYSIRILAMAAILDPRMKMKAVECYFPEIYGEEEGQSKISEVRTDLMLLYNDYVSQFGDNSSSLHSSLGGSSSSVRDDIVGGDDVSSLNVSWNSRVERLGKFLKETSSNLAPKNDFEMYLDEHVLPCNELFGDFDLLAWWKENFQKYPILGKVARDVLAVPVSTVASESAFSTGGRILDDYRSSLAPKTVDLCPRLVKE